MNNIDSNTISNILVIVLSVMFFILIVLVAVFIALRAKEKMSREPKKEDEIVKGKSKNNNTVEKNVSNSYSKQSIMNFMEFDKVEDNMIIQKKGKRYLMVVECQGVNYDLMSNVEKVAVEEGFQQFLNTLRHPIQIYIQTRTINLESSISNYKVRVKDIEDKYRRMMFEYNNMKESNTYSQEELDKYLFELTKQRNMLEYGKDIVQDTERMSLNKSVLNKKYYIIISYYAEENPDQRYAVEEIRNMAFSELYTKAQSIIRTLSACSISGKILSSKELIELLYVAYNRDESETFGVDKAMEAGYDDLYSTAPDVFEKKVKALDQMVHDKAVDLANETIEKVKSKNQQKAEDTEENMEELVRKMAQIIIGDNRNYVGLDTAAEAIKELENSKEEGEENNEGIKKTTRGRKKKTANS